MAWTTRDYWLAALAAVGGVTLAFLTGTTLTERVATLMGSLLLVFAVRMVWATVEDSAKRLKKVRERHKLRLQESTERHQQIQDDHAERMRQIQADHDERVRRTEEILGGVTSTTTTTRRRTVTTHADGRRTVNGVDNPQGAWMVVNEDCRLPHGTLILQGEDGRYTVADESVGGNITRADFNALVENGSVVSVARFGDPFQQVRQAMVGMGQSMNDMGQSMQQTMQSAFSGLDNVIADLDANLDRIDARDGTTVHQSDREAADLDRLEAEMGMASIDEEIQAAIGEPPPEPRSAWERMLDDDFE